MKAPFAAGVLFSCCLLAGPIMADGTDLTKTEITTTKINDHLYILEGGGSTVGVLIGSDGVLLADGAPAPLAEKILAAIRKLSNAPIRFVINLNGDPDHTGANEQFAAQGATILARQWRHAAKGKGLLTQDVAGQITVHLADESVVVRPLPAGHSAADMLVRFTSANVLMVGDIYRPRAYPDIDLANGGTLSGLVDALGEVGGMADLQTKIISSHGPAVSRPIVIAYRDIVIGVRDRVADLIKQGRTVDDVLAAKATRVYDGVFPQASSTADPFVREVFTELQHAR